MQNSNSDEIAPGDNPAPHSRAFRIDADAFYPEREFAAMTGQSLDALRRGRRERRDGLAGANVPFVKFGRKVFYRGDDILAALDALRSSSSNRGAGGRVRVRA